MFDAEPYNYIYNKGNCFTYGKFVQEDADLLEYVLKNLLQLNEHHALQLYYIQEVYPCYRAREMTEKEITME